MSLGPNRYRLFDQPRKYQKVNVTHRVPVFPPKPGVSVNLGMAQRGKYRTKNKKKRKQRRGIVKRRIPRALQPRTNLVKLRVSNYFPMTITTGTLSAIPIQGNSCDDPYTTQSGQQPLGYDQWKALYRRAYVIGSKIKANFHNTSSYSCMVGMTPMSIPQGTTNLTNYEYYRELPGTKSRLLSPDVDHTYMTHSVGTKKHLHCKNMTDEDDFKLDLVNEVAPTKIFYWHVWAQTTDQTNTAIVEAVIDVEYLILLTDPIVPSRSIET